MHWGVGGSWEGEGVREKGAGKEWGMLGDWEGGGRKDRYGIREEYISIKGVSLGFTRDLIINGIPGPRRDPQIVLWTEERVPEQALAHNHTDEYFAYHHRSFIWRWMEMETETHFGTLDLTPKVQTRSRRKEKVSKEGKIRGNLHPTMDGDTDGDPH